MTKLKNSNHDNSKTQIVKKLKNFKFENLENGNGERTQIVRKLKTQVVTKLKNLNFEKSRTQIVT